MWEKNLKMKNLITTYHEISKKYKKKLLIVGLEPMTGGLEEKSSDVKIWWGVLKT